MGKLVQHPNGKDLIEVSDELMPQFLAIMEKLTPDYKNKQEAKAREERALKKQEVIYSNFSADLEKIGKNIEAVGKTVEQSVKNLSDTSSKKLTASLTKLQSENKKAFNAIAAGIQNVTVTVPESEPIVVNPTPVEIASNPIPSKLKVQVTGHKNVGSIARIDSAEIEVLEWETKH